MPFLDINKPEKVSRISKRYEITDLKFLERLAMIKD